MGHTHYRKTSASDVISVTSAFLITFNENGHTHTLTHTLPQKFKKHKDDYMRGSETGLDS